MKVLSLFDGMACGYEALLRAWFTVDKYYASEIDKYAIQVALKNHPDIIEIWDVTQVKWEDYKDVDIIMWWSPCQWFSMAWKMLNFDDPRSKLFFEFVRLVREIKPKYFLLENVKMKKEFRDKISEIMWCEPILIDSALVSAQHRERYYWTNIPWITQPEDKGIMLKDVIITEPVEDKYYLNESQINTIKRNFGSKWKILNESDWLIEKQTFPSRINQIDGLDIKVPTLCTAMWTGGGNVPCIIQKVGDRDKNNRWVHTDKSYCLPANPMSDRWQLVILRWRPKMPYEPWPREWEYKEYSDKCPTLTENCASWDQKNIVAIAYAPSSREFKQQWFKTDKSPTLAARDYKDPKIVLMNNPEKQDSWDQNIIPKEWEKIIEEVDWEIRVKQATKQWYIVAEEWDGLDLSYPTSTTRRWRVVKWKSNTLTAWHLNYVYNTVIRKLTPEECEKLQTLDVGYTSGVSNSQRYKMLGNGRTVDVISHILSFIK